MKDAIVIVNGIEYVPKSETNPEQPKPLLSDAQVGDIVRLMNGEYHQMDDTCRQPHDIGVRVGEIWYNWDGTACVNTKNPDINIIHTEPLAAEGSAEWAWQMRCLLGIKVIGTNGVIPEGGFLLHQWLSQYDTMPAGWQIYEPEPEIAYACDTCRYNGQCTYTENKPRRIACNYYLAIEPVEPAPRFNVGEWVEYGNGTKICQAKILRICDNLYVVIDYLYSQYEFVLNGENIIRKLDPSEVKVRLTLEGTVERIDEFSFNLEKDGVVAELDYELLSPAQAELVRELTGGNNDSKV